MLGDLSGAQAADLVSTFDALDKTLKTNTHKG